MRRSSVRDRDDHVDLLALCRVKGLSWYLIAREALRREGLPRLLQGQVAERSSEATAARRLLPAALRALDAHRDAVAAILTAMRAAGVRLTTVLDADYPLNLRTIFNLPPFLFYRGALDANRDARSVAVVGTREASATGI